MNDYDTPEISAAFSKASARERSPTKQYLRRHFLLFSRRTFAGARFAERSTDLGRIIVIDVRLRLTFVMRSVVGLPHRETPTRFL